MFVLMSSNQFLVGLVFTAIIVGMLVYYIRHIKKDKND